jgi:hypothetical protein
MVEQRKVCTLLTGKQPAFPKKWGGIGFKELKLHNTAILIRWWWRAHSNPDSLATTVLTTIYFSHSHSNGPPCWKKPCSFFWRHLHAIRPLFIQCTTSRIGSGAQTSFWYDPWCDQPLVNANQSPPWPPMQKISVCNAAVQLDKMLPRPRTQHQEEATALISTLPFMEEQDSMI